MLTYLQVNSSLLLTSNDTGCVSLQVPMMRTMQMTHLGFCASYKRIVNYVKWKQMSNYNVLRIKTPNSTGHFLGKPGLAKTKLYALQML